MSWNLLKLRLSQLMDKPTWRESEMMRRIPFIPGELDKLYASHFDIATAGGKLTPSSGRSAGFQTYLQGIVKVNKLSPSMPRSRVTPQFGSQASTYWSGRIIDGPTGLTVVISPGIWTPLEHIPNFVPSAKKWSDRLVIAFYLQKLSLLGITISKAVPGMVTPWSGVYFQGLDAPGGLPAVVNPMMNTFSTYVDLLMLVTKGTPKIGEQLKQTFENNLNTVFTPALFEAVSKIPNVYGTDFNASNKVTDMARKNLQKLQ